MDTVQHLHIALAIIWRDGKILVTKRPADADHLPGLWEFPGGKCREGETPQECALRETREEVGLVIRIEREWPLITFHYPQRHVTLHPFDCSVVSGEPQSLQVAAWRWLAPHELRPEEFPPANAGLLEEIQANAYSSGKS